MSELDAYLGERESVAMPELRKTSFGRVEVGARDYLDDMLAAAREQKGEPDYLPDPMTKERWTGQARIMFRGRGYKPGFLGWALAEHFSEFAKQGKTPIVTGPMSLDYLWDAFAELGTSFKDMETCDICGAVSCRHMFEED